MDIESKRHSAQWDTCPRCSRAFHIACEEYNNKRIWRWQFHQFIECLASDVLGMDVSVYRPEGSHFETSSPFNFKVGEFDLKQVRLAKWPLRLAEDEKLFKLIRDGHQIEISDGRKRREIINTTPHSITFQSPQGLVYVVDPCGTLINAKADEVEVGQHRTQSGVTLVQTKFTADPVSSDALSKLEIEHPDAIVVGSIIAAQAYPGRVFALVPVEGYERVPPDQKRMRDDRFTVFNYLHLEEEIK